MNVVDSSGWIEYFVQGNNASFFEEAVVDVGRLVVPTVCLLEVYRFFTRKAGRSAAARAVSAMHQGRVVALDGTLALEAAHLGAHFRLPLADSVVYATARASDAIVWTQDRDFEGLEGVRFIPTKGKP